MKKEEELQPGKPYATWLLSGVSCSSFAYYMYLLPFNDDHGTPLSCD
jgi:hypothetical protein